MRKYSFENRKIAKRAGKKGGKNVPPEKRHFAMNREAAAAAGRKSRYVPPKPEPIYDDTEAKALFESIMPEYASELPSWNKLNDSARQFWRKQVKVVPKDDVDASTQIDLLGNTSELG